MSEPSKSDEKSSHTTSAIAIVAILFSLFAVQDTIFKPTRPPMINTERAFSEDARSRLWQDPFQAVEEYRKRYQLQQNQQSLYIEFGQNTRNQGAQKAKLFAETREKNALIPIPAPDKTAAYEYGNGLTRVCAGENLVKKHFYPDSEAVANTFKELHCDILKETEDRQKLKDPRKVHVIAVMVPGGPYAEDKERRLRSRYAVISALAETGIKAKGRKLHISYVAKDPDHIQFLDFDKACKAQLQEEKKNLKEEENLKEKKNHKLKDQSQTNSTDIRVCELRDIMPYEWFHPSSKKNPELPEVLVLWLDNDAFLRSKHPLNLLGYLIEKINDRETLKNIDLSFSIIGPHGSESLHIMSQEVNKVSDICEENQDKSCIHIHYRNLEKIHDEKKIKFYTATATIEQEELCNAPSSHNKLEGFEGNITSINSPSTRVDPCKELEGFEGKFINEMLVRTVSMQEAITQTLACELALRGINPTSKNEFNEKIYSRCQDKIRIEIPKPKEQDHIVFIGEKDNLFSRKLTDTFRVLFDPKKGEKDNLHFFNYLRGLDGITSEQASISSESKNKNKEAQENKVIDIRATLERPVGPSQLDYLVNLADQLKKLDEQIASNGEGGIKAIGITGSDTYDKLLILQALHNKFPGVLFFTTDLDSRLFHPSEIKWTRNLIVASAFGLTFNNLEHSKIQDDTPPFRDTFQSSIFLSTRLALCKAFDFEGCDIINNKQNIPEWTQYPRLFEIGNHGPIDISHNLHPIMPDPEIERLRKLHLHSTDSLEKDYSIIKNTFFIPIASFVLILSGLFCTLFLPKDYHPRVIVATFVLIALFFGYLYLITGTSLGGEPVSFTNGISSWPRNGITLLAIILCVFFIWRINRQIKASWNETEKRFLLNNPSNTNP